ncbi:MAG: glycosyl transferase family 39 [Gammaproteobacteria bacterium]|nr:MAG: glycosyl transferase family 39 [Gammaproteobacteria bacterium]
MIKLFWREQPLLWILILAAVLRVVWALLVPVIPVSDSAAYEIFAWSLASGQGYAYADGTLTAYWAPGAAFVYGAFFWLFGETYLPIVIFQLLVGVWVVYLGYRLAGLVLSRNASLLCALFLAVWPVLIQFTTVLASELLFLVPVLLATILVFERKTSGLGDWLLFGLLVGVAAYIRPTALPLLLVLPVMAAFRYRNVRALPGWLVVGSVACALIVAPWSIRNTQLFGEFTTISTNFGPNLWMGNNPESRGVYQPLAIPDGGFEHEKQREDYFRSLAVTFIKENPGEFLRLGVLRARATFDRETIGVAWNVEGLQQRFGESQVVLVGLKLVSSGWWYLMLGLAVVGTVFLVMRERMMLLTNPLFMLAGFFAAFPVIMVGQDRYHMAMIPMLAALAAYGCVQLSMRFRKSWYL